jgi:Phage capsid family
VQSVKDIALIAHGQLAAGQPARVVASGKQVAFAWSSGTLAGLTSVVDSAITSQMNFTTNRVHATGTPAAAVTAGSAKPTAFDLVAKSIALKKFSGITTANFESLIDAANLTNAVAMSLVHGAALAWEKDLVATILADADILKHDAVPGAAGILAAQAMLLENGNQPDILALSPADYASVLGASGTAGTLTVVSNPQEAVQTLFGSQIVVSAGLATGTALLMSKDACLAVEHDQSPAILVDPYSGSSNNTIKVVADVVAGCIVARPNAVVQIKDTP